MSSTKMMTKLGLAAPAAPAARAAADMAKQNQPRTAAAGSRILGLMSPPFGPVGLGRKERGLNHRDTEGTEANSTPQAPRLGTVDGNVFLSPTPNPAPN